MRRSSCGALLLGPLLVFLLIGGLGFYLVSQKVQERLPSTSPTEQMQATSTETILLVFANPRTPYDEVAALDLPATKLRILTPPKGWRLASRDRQGLRVEELPVGDVFRVTRADGWNVVLRDPAGRAYQDPVVVGFFDQDHVAILAHTDERVLLDVSRLGEVRVLRRLDDAMSVRLVQNGIAWLIQGVLGEGIEDPMHGPSSLTQLTRAGVSTTLAESPGTIARVVPFSRRPDVFAYGTEEGTYTAVSGVTKWQGQGVPLLWTDEETLLFTQGTMLYRRRASTSTSEKVIDLRAIPQAGFVSSTQVSLW